MSGGDKKSKVEHKSVRSALATAARVPQDRSILFKLPTDQLSTILGLLSLRESASFLWGTMPVFGRTVQLDQEHWPIIVAENILSDDDGSKALVRFLGKFRRTGRRLVVDTLCDQWNWEWPGDEPARLCTILQRELPLVEEVELQCLTRFGQRKPVPLRTFLPAKPGQLRRLILRNDRLDVNDQWLAQWSKWCAEQKFVGPLDAFGCGLNAAPHLEQLLKQWTAWDVGNRPRELELRSPSSYSPGIHHLHHDFPLDLFCSHLHLLPRLRRIRLFVNMHFTHSGSVVSRLLQALAANRLHDRLLELQVFVEGVNDKQRLNADDVRVLSECTALTILALDMNEVVLPADAKEALDPLDALEHVSIRSSELADQRTKPWPRLKTIHFPPQGMHDLSQVQRDYRRLVPATAPSVVGHADVSWLVGADPVGWLAELACPNVQWSDVSFSPSFYGDALEGKEDTLMATWLTWIRQNTELKRISFHLFNGATSTLTFGDAFLDAWRLTPIPTHASPSEPSRHVRPLEYFHLRVTYKVNATWSRAAMDRFCEACPGLEAVIVDVDRLHLDAQTARALVKGLPRLRLLQLTVIHRTTADESKWSDEIKEWSTGTRFLRTRLRFYTSAPGKPSTIETITVPDWPHNQPFVIAPVHAFLAA